MKLSILTLTYCLASAAALAQLTGPTSVTVGSTQQYTYNSTVGTVTSPNWQANLGTPQSPSGGGLHFTVNVNWTSVGSGSVTFRNGTTQLANLPVTVSAGIPAVPSPSGPSGITTTSFSFSWASVPYATSYRIDASST